MRSLTLLQFCSALLCLCAGMHCVAAEPVIRLDQLGADGKLVMGGYLGHLEDRSGQQGIDAASASAQAALYEASQLDRPNFGYSSAAHWLRFTIDGGTAGADLLLELAAPTLDDVKLFSPQAGGGYSLQAVGDLVPWGAREIRHRHFVLRVAVPRGPPATFYLRLASSSAVTAPLTLWRPVEFAAADRVSTLWLGMFYGLLTAQFFYNLFLFFSLRDRAYLIYIVYVAMFGLSLSILDGLAFQFLWPNNVVWANRALAALLLATMMLGSQFARAFLEPHKHAPAADRVMQGFGIICGALMVCAATGFALEPRHYSQIITWLTLCGVPIVLWPAVRAIFNGYRPARYFMLAWSALLCAMWFSALRNFAVLPINFFSEHGLHIGLALDVVLLSTALADRIRVLRDDMIAAQARLIDASRHYQTVLERRATELTDANRELENFSYTVAHDLRSPLRAIDSYAHLLKEEAGTQLGPDAQRDLALISGSARQMAQLIDGLLNFSRIGRATPAMSTVDMQVLAETVARELNPRGSVTLHIAALPAVQGDPIMLRQVWANLIGNAIKFSAKQKTPLIEIAHESTGLVAVFSVRDNGAGFDMRYADKLFSMFQRLHAPSEFEGTGIGLAIVKRVIERHGGRIWAASELGTGTCFYFQLPLAQVEALASNPTEHHAANP